MATPTIAGAREMLKYLGVTPITKGSMGHKVIITDLREEAVVYIDGTPFVLRELNNPVDTLKHVGITGPVVCHHECLFFFFFIPKASHLATIRFLCSYIHFAGGTHGGTPKRRYLV